MNNTSQFSASAKNSIRSGIGGYANSLNLAKAESWKTGFGLTLLIDASRALNNWALATQIENIRAVQPFEEAARNKIKVKENAI